MSYSSNEIQSNRERRHWVVRWVLVEGNRLLVAGLLMGGFFLILASLSTVDVVGFTDEGVIAPLAGGMIAGTLSLITIVLTINQLILSQELGHAGTVREQTEATLALRNELETKSKIPISPDRPVDFIHAVVHVIREDARRLRDQVTMDDRAPAPLPAELQQYASDIMKQGDHVQHLLADIDPHTLRRITDILEYQQGFGLNAGRALLNKSSGKTDPRVEDALRSLIRSQRLFLVSQSYAKAVYLERELAQLSRMMLYVGLPAATTAFIIGFAYGDLQESILYPKHLQFVIPVMLTIILAPLALLAAYMVRIATITQRTVTGGTFLA